MEQKTNVLCLCNKNIVYVNQDKLKINVYCFYLMSSFLLLLLVVSCMVSLTIVFFNYSRMCKTFWTIIKHVVVKT